MNRYLSGTFPVLAEVDVLVCGAGCAGVGAALASARLGVATMAVESAPYLGGFITAQMSPHLDGLFDVETGELVVGGVAVEVVQSSCGIVHQAGDRYAMGGSLTPNLHTEAGAHDPWNRTILHLNVEEFKVSVESLLSSAGVRLLYHTRVAAVEGTEGHIDGVVVASKSGLGVIRAKQIVDCTGDGDVAAWAGAKFEQASDPQPMTTHFRIGNVGVSSSLADECARVLTAARRDGTIAPYGGPWLTQLGPGDISFNATRVPADRTDAFDLTRAEVDGRSQAWRILRALKELPEFQDAYMLATGPESGGRESRRVIGRYTITEEDIRSSRRFADVIVRGSWYLDRHVAGESGFHPHPVVRPYDIPFRTLVTEDVSNLVVAGRCHSATRGALASTRVAITAMGMGQAAGTAAAIAVRDGLDPRDIRVPVLQDQLVSDGAILA